VATDTAVTMTPGSGESIHVIKQADGKDDQVVREAAATAVGTTSHWTLSLSAANPISADISRRAAILTNTSQTGNVYVRYDTTSPTTASDNWHDKIPPNGRLVVEKELVTLAMSFVADVASGYLEYVLATAA
jgi:hypothetical protein